MWTIYLITNNTNGKRYIGQHKYADKSNPMKRYDGSGVLLKNAYRKYGKENFTKEILVDEITSKEMADALEIAYIREYQPEYNISKGGTGGLLGTSQKGKTPWNKGKKTGPLSKKECEQRSKNIIGRHFYNNGIIEKLCYECPEGFVEGRLLFSNDHIQNSKAAIQRYYLSHPGSNKGKAPWNKGKKTGQKSQGKSVINIESNIEYRSVKELLESEHISKTKYYRERKENGKYKYTGK